MPILYHAGYIDVEAFRKACDKAQLDPSMVIFLFPVTVSHHNQLLTLHSIKEMVGKDFYLTEKATLSELKNLTF